MAKNKSSLFKNLKKHFNEKNLFVFILVFALIILLMPYLIRIVDYDSVLIGQMPYYHARIASSVISKGLPNYDKLSYGGREYIFNPYHLILAGFSYVFGVDFASKLLPFLLGISSLLIFYLIIKNFGFNLDQRALILFIFVMSPLFIYCFSVSNSYSAAIFLLLMGFYLFVKKKKVFFVFSVISFFLASFFGILNAIITITLLLNYLLLNKKKLKRFFIVLFVLLAASSLYYLPFYVKHGLPENFSFISVNVLQQSVSDMGSLFGFAVFALILALIGLIITWKNKKQLIFVYLTILILVIASFYLKYSNMYLNFIFSVFGGIALVKIIKLKWEVEAIKRLTILVLICGLIFSTVSYLTRISNLEPNKDIISSLEWLKDNSEPNDVVFSHYSRGFWIEFFGRPVVMDSMFNYAPDVERRFNDSQQIFYDTHLEHTKNLLKKYNISYIWIDKKMKQGLVWTKKEQGLLFLFRNKETFKNIYNKGNVEIWKVIS